MSGRLETLPGGYRKGVQNLDRPQKLAILYD